jgi:hypothetical protein
LGGGVRSSAGFRVMIAPGGWRIMRSSDDGDMRRDREVRADTF